MAAAHRSAAQIHLTITVTALRSLGDGPYGGGKRVKCSRCGFDAHQPGRFCPACGLQTGLTVPYQNLQPAPYGTPLTLEHHAAHARGFGQIFGIHPTIAFVALIVDLMLFGGELATAGALLPVSIGAGAVLGYITYLAQRKWYGDDKESALIKGLILGFLTAIPTPLPSILSIPSGIVGLVHSLRKK